MTVGLVSRWARRYVAFAACCLFAAFLVVLVDGPARAMIAFALYGFVFHVVFGKAYSLVPSYFDVDLAWPGVVRVQGPATAVGALALALAAFGGVPALVGSIGAVLWAGGVVAFVVTVSWTIRSNPSGARTGTGPGKAHLAGLDRVANAFVPVALAYLLAGALATLVGYDVLPPVLSGVTPVFDGYPPRATHLLGTGTATVLVFALGSRLFPRFLVVDPPRALFVLALGAGAIGPVLLAASLPAGSLFGVAATVEAVAVSSYALGFGVSFWRSGRDRVAFWGVLAGAAFGVVAVAIGAWFAVDGVSAGLLAAHRRVTLLGFLGLTVVGVTLQFYPPAVGQWRYCSNRTGVLALGSLAGGVALNVGGLVLEATWSGGNGRAGEALATLGGVLPTVGGALALAGVALYGYVLAGAFATR